MLPEIEIFSHIIPTYGLIVLLGLILGVMRAIFWPVFSRLNRDDILFSAIYGGIGLVVGGKLFYLVTILPALVHARQDLVWSRALLEALLTGGFVFFGGLFGGILGIFIYARQYHKNFAALLENIVPSLPLMHAVGRIGCFFAGCCYGLEVPPHWGFPFPVAGRPQGTHFFPTQLAEAAVNLFLFFILLRLCRRPRPRFFLFFIYATLYSFFRFLLEFLRGDAARGLIGGLSISQWISVGLFSFCLVWLFRRHRDEPFFYP